MKIILSRHVLKDKIPLMKSLGWHISQTKIKQTIKNPKWSGKTKLGQETAMDLIDEKHILRVIYEHRSGIIQVITAHIARRGTYESTKD